MGLAAGVGSPSIEPPPVGQRSSSMSSPAYRFTVWHLLVSTTAIAGAVAAAKAVGIEPTLGIGSVLLIFAPIAAVVGANLWATDSPQGRRRFALLVLELAAVLGTLVAATLLDPEYVIFFAVLMLGCWCLEFLLIAVVHRAWKEGMESARTAGTCASSPERRPAESASESRLPPGVAAGGSNQAALG